MANSQLSTGVSAAFGPCPDWVPSIDIKLDPKQITYTTPFPLIPVARAVFYKRYIECIGQQPGFYVHWIDLNKDNEQLHIDTSSDLNQIKHTHLPTDLFKTKIQVNYGLNKLVTVSVYYTTGTILVQGNRCKNWVTSEFKGLTQVTRHTYAYLSSDNEHNVHQKLNAALSHLRVPTVTILQSSDVVIEDISDSESQQSHTDSADASPTTGTNTTEPHLHPHSTTTTTTRCDDSVGGHGTPCDSQRSDGTTEDGQNSGARIADTAEGGDLSPLPVLFTTTAQDSETSGEDGDLPAALTTNTVADSSAGDADTCSVPPNTNPVNNDGSVEGGGHSSAVTTVTKSNGDSAEGGCLSTAALLTVITDTDEGSAEEGFHSSGIAAISNNEGSVLTSAAVPTAVTDSKDTAEDGDNMSSSIAASTVNKTSTGGCGASSTPSTTVTAHTGGTARDEDDSTVPMNITTISGHAAGQGDDGDGDHPSTTITTASTTSGDGDDGDHPSTAITTNSNTSTTITSNVTEESLVDPLTTTAPTSTADGVKASRQRSRKIRVGGWRSAAHTVTMSLLQRKLKNTRKQVAQLTKLFLSTTPIVQSIIETHNKQVKSEIKTHVKYKYEAQSEEIASLASKVKALSDQNNALKSQLTDLKKQLNEGRCTVPTKNKTNKYAQTDKQGNLSNTSTSDKHAQKQSLIVSVKDDQHSLPSQKSTNNNVSIPFSTNTSSDQTTHAPLSSTVSRSAASSSTPTLPANAPASHSQPAACPPVGSIPDNSRTVVEVQQSPGQQLAECRVGQDTTHLLIGDSILCPVQPDLLFPQTVCQKIAVPGLTLADLVHWLKHVPRSHCVQKVVVHVGVNTCRDNTVTESQWRQLLRLFKSVFQTSQTYMSAIVPPRGRHLLTKTVAVSNSALAAVCTTEGAGFVDHTSTFQTPTGAPRKALYKDALHPSRQGTMRLMQDLKRTGGLKNLSHRHPPTFPRQLHRSQPTHRVGDFRRPALLPTPVHHHPSLNQHHYNPVHHHPFLSQHHYNPVHHHPSRTQHHYNPVHQEFPPVLRHHNPVPHNPSPSPIISHHQPVSCNRNYASTSASLYLSVPRHSQPPSYSAVASRRCGYHPSSAVFCETQV